MALDVKRAVGARVARVLRRPLWVAVKAISGRRLQSPTRFLDLEVSGGVFEARAEAVDERLPQGFSAIEHGSGRTMLRVLGVDCREVDLLGPFLGLAIELPVRWAPRGGQEVEGWWAFQVPVSTEEARWGAVANYGFPSFVADIRVRRAGGRAVWTLVHGRQLVLELDVDEAGAEPRTLSARSFSARDDGAVVQSGVELFGHVGESPDLGTARLELGFHQVADQLRAMGVATAGRAVRVPEATATLSAGEVVGRLEQGRRPPRRPFEAQQFEA
jgi:hypothetical protein